MLKRIITGSVLIAVLVGFFALRTVDYRFFDIVIAVFAAVGTYEFVKMAGKNLSNVKKTVLITEGILLVPAYVVFESFFNAGFTASLAVIAIAVIAVLCLLVFEYDDKIENAGITLIGIVYPCGLLVFMLALNRFEVASYTGIDFVPLIMPFVIAPLSDTFAYFVGVVFGKRKMCPKISPNKTVAGGIGGILGGVLGGIIIYVIFRPEIGLPVPILIFAVIGLVGGILTETGDLIESALKRKFGVKDSGNIFPGHGGVLDRTDSIIFVCWFIYALFSLIL